MLKTLDRYLIREVIPPFLLTLLIFTFILELPPLMEQLEDLVAKGVPWGTAGHIILLLLPQALGLTIPMALLVGLLIGLSRMSADREAVALLACGVSPYRLLRPVLVLAGIATLATLYVMIDAIPDSNQKYREIVFDILTRKVESDVKPRVFYTEFPNWVIYPRDEPDPGQGGWKDVMVAETSKPDAPVLYLAERGKVVIDRPNRKVELVLTNGTQYTTAAAGETKAFRFTEHFTIGLDPDTVFPPLDLPRSIPEKTIAQLKADIVKNEKLGLSTHNEVMGIHAKFSIPAACLVFAVTALALGLTVARDGKMGGFVVGIGVIFVYYVTMFLAESMAKGHRLPPEIARWVPNLLVGPFGLGALIWRARHAEGRLPFRLLSLQPVREWWRRRQETPGTSASAAPTAGKRGVVVVVRIPRLHSPMMPGLIDRYIGRIYIRVVALSFMALLGLFYISTFIDRSDKLFKGQADAGMVGHLLLLLTPQFVYFVIPIAVLLSGLVTFGLLARSSELTVLKACGVSLYRASASVLVLSLGFSAVLFALEQRVMASANRRAEILDAQIKGRTPRTLNLLNRRWVVGRDGAVYHYGLFDQQRWEMFSLSIFRPRVDDWSLRSQTFARHAAFRDGAWRGTQGWTTDYSTDPPNTRKISKAVIEDIEPPEYFASEQPIAELMTVAQLRSHIAELKASGANVVPLTVDLQAKIAFPFVTLVMTLLAIPFGVSMGRRGTLYGIGLGIVIALSYWITIKAFVAIGRGGLLPPEMAAWAPNVLALGIASYLYLRART